jgi:hypothetical protein
MKKLVSILVGLSFSFSIFAFNLNKNYLNESYFTVNYSILSNNIHVVMEESLQGFMFNTTSTSSITCIVYYFKSNNIEVDTLKYDNCEDVTYIEINNIIRFKIINDAGNTTSTFGLYNLGYLDYGTPMELPLGDTTVNITINDTDLGQITLIDTQLETGSNNYESEVYLSGDYLEIPTGSQLFGIYDVSATKVSDNTYSGTSIYVGDLQNNKIYVAVIKVNGEYISYKFLKQ